MTFITWIVIAIVVVWLAVRVVLIVGYVGAVLYEKLMYGVLPRPVVLVIVILQTILLVACLLGFFYLVLRLIAGLPPIPPLPLAH